jgi:UPF0755 protein
MPDHAPGSAAQQRNKVWIKGGVAGHFARVLGYLLLIPVHLIILIFSALIYAAAWAVHHLSFRGWLRGRTFEPAVVGLAALLVILAMTFYGPFSSLGTAGQERTVVIERGMGLSQIADRLASEEIIHSADQFTLVARLLGLGGRLQAGRYLLSAGSRPIDVIRRLSRGGVVSQMVTVPEGLTIRQTAELLQRESGIDAARFETLANDPRRARRCGIPARSLEGYLFPDTYGLYWSMPAGEVIDILFSRFREIYTDEMDRRAEQLGLSRHQVVTLASMIEEEARVDEERPLISAVYHNRLREGMLLQCDPTVIYALGGKRTPLTRNDLQVDSPYNTYRHPGLPPGPISSPGLASIRAALYPADVDYLYFVARGDGSHQFSQTSREHINAIHRIRRNLGG